MNGAKQCTDIRYCLQQVVQALAAPSVGRLGVAGCMPKLPPPVDLTQRYLAEILESTLRIEAMLCCLSQMQESVAAEVLSLSPLAPIVAPVIDPVPAPEAVRDLRPQTTPRPPPPGKKHKKEP